MKIQLFIAAILASVYAEVVTTAPVPGVTQSYVVDYQYNANDVIYTSTTLSTINPSATSTSTNTATNTVIMTCPHIESELEKKDFLRKLTLGVNWGIYTLHAAPSKTTTRCKLSQKLLTRPQLCLTCANCFHFDSLLTHSAENHNFCTYGRIVRPCILFWMQRLHIQSTTREAHQTAASKARRASYEEKKWDNYPLIYPSNLHVTATNGSIRSSFRPLNDVPKVKLTNGVFSNPIALRPRGFRNLGKTCFLNVVLQAFIANPLLRSYFLSEKHNHILCSKEGCMACEFDKLFMQVHQPDLTPLGPISLLHTLWTAPGASDLAGYAQQDAHEAYISLLNLIHAGCTTSENIHSDECSCIIHQTFQGTLQSELKCGKCNYASVTSDPFLDVSLDVGTPSSSTNGVSKRGSQTMSKNTSNGAPKNGKGSSVPTVESQTLDNCLKRYTHPEHSDWKCTSCSANEASTKQLSFKKLPTVLAFQIKRYEHGLWAQKLDAPVRFPLVLDMRPYVALGDDDEPDEMYLYDLFCVINHLGEMDTGHYTCASRFGEQWFRCEDADVVPTTIKSVLDSQGYMLLYIKRTLVYCKSQSTCDVQLTGIDASS
ncbi:cysteine proteinase [Wallemia mellicola]|uniref:Cysteine proteinase n=1 Tax=Wallemia mellicola TaxID=1708541 RepID=A0A4T0QCF8_9BASI|nr:hypothetical protein E3Q24_04296 [Wallemia mellicola]TIB69320.1 hypothetical protein E3Q23_04320 [Wallemia mellicola]TIB84938.1 cysteine proteinase [Wallemia mellicola]TIB95106.1 cysteine proteinase [Wallemia mellicola]TIC21600.1 cysteine proteinase [Wallemia mellicola]